MKKKRKMSFTEMLANERDLIRQNPEMMERIEQKLEERLSQGVMRAAEK